VGGVGDQLTRAESILGTPRLFAEPLNTKKRQLWNDFLFIPDLAAAPGVNESCTWWQRRWQGQLQKPLPWGGWWSHTQSLTQS